MKYNLHIIRKPVKYLRLKVVDGQNIQAVAPKLMPQSQIQKFVQKKEGWIAKQLQKFQDANKKFELADNELLLHGVPYTRIHRAGQGTQYTLDHRRKILRWGYDVLNQKNTLHRYKTYAKHVLPTRLAGLASKHNIDYDKCFIRDQKTKRGSCSSAGHIGLNRRLVKMPTRVMDYVITHELAHRIHMNHSHEFRDYCTQLCPKTDEARKRLKTYGRALH